MTGGNTGVKRRTQQRIMTSKLIAAWLDRAIKVGKATGPPEIIAELKYLVQ